MIYVRICLCTLYLLALLIAPRKAVVVNLLREDTANARLPSLSNRPVHEGERGPCSPRPSRSHSIRGNNRNAPLRLKRAALFIALLLVGDCKPTAWLGRTDMRPLCATSMYINVHAAYTDAIIILFPRVRALNDGRCGGGCQYGAVNFNECFETFIFLRGATFRSLEKIHHF